MFATLVLTKNLLSIHFNNATKIRSHHIHMRYIFLCFATSSWDFSAVWRSSTDSLIAILTLITNRMHVTLAALKVQMAYKSLKA